MKDFLNAISLLPEDVTKFLSVINKDFMGKVNEIRFRSNKPLTLNTREGAFYCTKNGRVTVNFNDDLYFTDDRKWMGQGRYFNSAYFKCYGYDQRTGFCVYD